MEALYTLNCPPVVSFNSGACIPTVKSTHIKHPCRNPKHPKLYALERALAPLRLPGQSSATSALWLLRMRPSLQ